MSVFGAAIKKLREADKLPLRKVAAFLDIDQASLSKMENGVKKPKREHVIQLAKYFKADKNELLIMWMADKIVYEVEDEDLALQAQAMMAAEQQIKYQTSQKK